MLVLGCPTRQNGDFGRNCLLISAVFVQNLGGKTQAWYPILIFLPTSAVLVRNLGRKSQAWYPPLSKLIPLFSDQMFMGSTYFLPIFRSIGTGPVLQRVDGHACSLSSSKCCCSLNRWNKFNYIVLTVRRGEGRACDLTHQKSVCLFT